ncbi:MAG: PAS domain S-box protein [Methanoregula sp.]
MAAFDQEKVDKIKQYLRWHPRGMTISDLSSKTKMNRNMVAKYLDLLLISGQVEMQITGAAKVYFLSHRVPISAMLEFSSDYVIVLDTGQIVIQVNEPVLKFLNEKREALIGKKISEITNPFFSCLPTPEPVKNGQIAEEKITEMSSLLHGETFHFRVKQVPTAFEDGGQGFTYLIEDITAKKTSEESLKISEARYRGIVEDQTEFITRFHPDGTLTFVNESYARYLGKIPAELLGRFHIPGINDEDLVMLNQALQSLDKEHPVTTIDCRVSDPSGRVCWNLWTIRALFDDKGMVHEYQGVGRDNTEKREAAAKINNYIKIMEFLSQTGKAFMDMGEGDDIYAYVAQQVYSLAPGFLVWVGYLDEPNQKLILKSVVGNPIALDTMQQLTGMKVADMTFPINKADTAELIRHRRLVKTPPLFRLLHMQVPDERCRQIEEAAGGIESYLMGLVSKGRILGDVGISLQSGSELPNRELIEAFIRQAAIAIDRKIAEDALKKSEQQYRSVIDNIQDIFYRTDRDGNLIMASPSWAHILGYRSLDECIGRNIADTFYQEPAKRKEFLDAVCRYGEVRDYEVVLKRKDGTPLFVAVSSHQYYDESGDVLGIEGIIRDVTERHAAAEKIRNHIAQIKFFSRKLQEFIELPPASDIYLKIATDLHSLVPDAMIIVNSHDNTTGNLTVRSILSDADRDKCTQHLGRVPLGLSMRLDYAAIEGLREGRLHKLPLSLFELCFRQIPEDICKKIAASVNMGDFYSIGFVQGDEIYGNATICLYKGSAIQNLPLIETYAFQASIALQRRVAEDALKESERKRAEDALKNSENYLLKIFNSTQSGLVVIDPETHAIFDANSTAAELIGTDKNSIVGSICKKWFCPTENDLCPVMDLGQQLVRSEGVLNTIKGEKRSILRTVVPVQLGEHEYFLESFVDITERKKAEEALRESERKFRAIIDHSYQFIGLMKTDGTLIEANRSALDCCGIHASDVVGKPFWDTPWWSHSEELQDRLRDAVSRAAAGEFVRFEATHPTADGHLINVDFSLKPVLDDQGGILYLIPEGRDITERKIVEKALQESEERLSGVVKNAPIGIAFSDSHSGVIEYINPEFVKILGYTLDSNPNMADWFEQMYPDPEYRQKLYEIWMNDMRRLAGKNTYTDNIFRVRCKDGSDKDIRWRVVHFTNGKALTITEDFSGRKKAEEALKESEKKFRDIAEMLPQSVWECDVGGNLTFANRRSFDMYRYDLEDLDNGVTIWQMMHPNDRDRVKKEVFQGFNHGPQEFPELYHYTALRKDGSSFPIEIYATLVVRKDQIVGMRGIGIDITERRKAEEALRESEKRFHDLAEMLPQNVWECDAQGNLTFANQRSLEMYRYDPEDLDTGLTIWQMIHPGDRERVFNDFVEGLMHEPKKFPECHEFTALRKDGSTFPLLVYHVPIVHDNKITGMRGIGIDITDRKLAEEALRQSEARLYTILHSSPIPKYVIGSDYRVMYWNKALEEFSGIKAQDIIGTTRRWQAISDPVRPCLADLMIDGNMESVQEWYMKKIIPSKFMEGAVEMTDFFPHAGEGGKWLHHTAVAIKDGKGNILGAVETIEDITDRHHLEKLKFNSF